MLLGRSGPLAAIRSLLDAAGQGRSGAVLIRGEAGVGKTKLLEFARAEASGMEVLSARGREFEAELPFAGLHMLLAPVLDRLDALAETPRSALVGALALGPPSTSDRFAVYVATLELLGVVAERRSCLVLVDDAHWFDRESAEALAFVARRLDTDPIAMLFAARTEELGAAFGDLPDLALPGLDRDSALILIAQTAGSPTARDVAERIVDHTAGNPLAIIELVSLLSEAQLAGAELLEQPLPVGPGIESAFRRQVERLAEPARGALVIASTSDSGAIDEIAAAIAAMGGRVDALQEAEDAGLIRVEGGHVEFRYPLVRSAAYHSASARARRLAHAALAGVLTAPRSASRRAWHLAAAAVTPDEQVAAELEQAARDALVRAAPAAAGAAFEGAARLSPHDRDRARRLLDAGRALHVSGRSHAGLKALDEALERGDRALRGEIQLARAQAQMLARPLHEPRDLLAYEAPAIEGSDPATAAQMLLHLCAVCAYTGDNRSALETARRASTVAARVGGPVELLARMNHGIALIHVGQAPVGYPLTLAAEPLLDAHELVTGTPVGGWLALAASLAGDLRRAQSVVARTVRAQRDSGAIGLLGYTLAMASDIEFRRSRWDAAYAAATESVEFAERLGQLVEISYSLSRLAQVEAFRGREREARTAGERALELAESANAGAVSILGAVPLAHLELAAGRTERAIERLEAIGRAADASGLGEPNVARWQADLIEGYVRAGRQESARAALARLEDDAARTRGSWAHAVAARCHALLADDAELDAYLQYAMAAHDECVGSFERARTLLVFGERLRRARRSADARPLLREALETFDRLPADLWAERARRELAASGAREARRQPRAATASLTAQELRVALEVAEGKSNREVAASLFLTVKTVEAHLTRTFRKLGVRSRTELTRRLLDEGAIETVQQADRTRVPPGAAPG